MNRILFPLLPVLFPLILVAERVTPSIGFAGAPTDHNGQTCVTCHASNGDTRGSLTVTVGDYTPSKPQLITIVVQHPTAGRAGFQITIRQVSDETKTAGAFTPGDPVQDRCDDGSQFGLPGPCNGQREFAEHINAPTMVNGAFEFDVQWTPPNQEVGDLHVYSQRLPPMAMEQRRTIGCLRLSRPFPLREVALSTRSRPCRPR